MASHVQRLEARARVERRMGVRMRTPRRIQLADGALAWPRLFWSGAVRSSRIFQGAGPHMQLVSAVLQGLHLAPLSWKERHRFSPRDLS